MSQLEYLEEALPIGWRLTHLIRLEGDWQAIIQDDEHVAVATGPGFEEAIGEAVAKAVAGVYSGRLFTAQLAQPGPRLTLAALGLAKPPLEFKRRV